METRVMETLLLYAKDTLTGTFKQARSYMEHDIQTTRSEWIRTADTYIMELGMLWEEIKSMERKKFKMLIKEWDTQ